MYMVCIQLVLFCMVSDDLTYSHATPTFHHWQTGSCSYGLTFQSPSEADTFAKAVERSVGAMRHESESSPDGICFTFDLLETELGQQRMLVSVISNRWICNLLIVIILVVEVAED